MKSQKKKKKKKKRKQIYCYQLLTILTLSNTKFDIDSRLLSSVFVYIVTVL